MAVTIPSQYSTYANTGPQLLASQQITMAQLDNAVRHVLTLKYLAGMFAHPYTDPTRVQHAELTPANLAAARNSAGRSMVLLEDRNKALPLSTSLKSVAVVGPLGNDPTDQLGPDVPVGYDITPGQGRLGAGRNQGGAAGGQRHLRAGVRCQLHDVQRVRRRGHCGAGHRRWRRGRRRPVRQGEPGRQAADVVPAECRPDTDLLQRAPHRPALRSGQQVHVQVPRRAEHAPVPIRLRALLHHVLADQPAAVEHQPAGRWLAHCQRGRHQHRVGHRRSAPRLRTGARTGCPP